MVMLVSAATRRPHVRGGYREQQSHPRHPGRLVSGCSFCHAALPSRSASFAGLLCGWVFACPVASASNASNDWGWPGLPRVNADLLPTTTTTTLPPIASSWPSPIDGYTRGDSSGSLPQQEAVDRDWRHYYRVVALELLLVHHGFRRCEPTSSDELRDLNLLTGAVEAFQSRHNLTVNFLHLDRTFWTTLVVPVKIGESNSAVLALRWLTDATSKATRPPLWDPAYVDKHRCMATFTVSLEADVVKLLGAQVSSGLVAANRSTGVQPDTWKALLNMQEVRGSSGCTKRSFVARVFGVCWVWMWFAFAMVFALTHTEGWSHNVASVVGAEEIASKALPIRIASGLRYFMKQIDFVAPRMWRDIWALMAMAVSHNLALLGVWSFPHDLVAHLLVGWILTGGAIIAVRLTTAVGEGPKGRRWVPKRLLQVMGFSLGNMALYFLLLRIPNFQRMGAVILLAGVVAFWSMVAAWVTDLRLHVARGGLLFIMCILVAVLPTLIMVALSMVTFEADGRAIWLLSIVPTMLLLLIVLSEYVGEYVEEMCEYTAETQWLLAAIFRLGIELVRFSTALAVLLLVIFMEYSFGFLILHVGQTFVYELLMRSPTLMLCWSHLQDPLQSLYGVKRLLSTRKAQSRSTPFTAGDIVLSVDVDPWAYRFRAAMLPIEVLLFVTHLCQLLYIGMPVGVDAGAWIGGLAIIACASIGREALTYSINVLSGKMTFHMPWVKMPAHIIALMIGVGLSLSSFAQVSVFWHLYAHHWAACFIGGAEDASVESADDSQAEGAVAITIIGILALGTDVFSFISWAEWMAKVRQQQLGQARAGVSGASYGRGTRKQLSWSSHDTTIKVPDDVDEPAPEQPPVSPSLRASGDVGSSPLKASIKSSGSTPMRIKSSGSTVSHFPIQKSLSSGMLFEPDRPIRKSSKTQILDFTPADQDYMSETQESKDRLARTWDLTLTLFEQDPESPEGSRSAKDWTDKVETSTKSALLSRNLDALDEWSGALRVPSKDMYSHLSEQLLENVQAGRQSLRAASKEAKDATPQQEDFCRNTFLDEVLADLPEDTSDIIVAPSTPLPARLSTPLPVRQSTPLTALPGAVITPDDEVTLHEEENIWVKAASDHMDQSGLRDTANATQDNSLLQPSDTRKSDTVDRLLSKFEMGDDEDIGCLLEATLKPSESPDESMSTQAPGTGDITKAAGQSVEAAESVEAAAATELKELEAAAEAAAAKALEAGAAKEVAEELAHQERLAEEQAWRDAEEKQRAAEEARRVAEERKAAEEEAKRAADEAARVEAERRAEAERRRAEAERIESEARAEAARVEAERKAEAARIEAQCQAERKAEAARVEATRLEHEATIKAAADALSRAMIARSREDLELRLEEATAIGVSEYRLDEATSVLEDIIAEENRNAAAAFLDEACNEQDIEQLRLAITRAQELNVSVDAIQAAQTSLKELVAEEERREAALQKLLQVIDVAPGDEESLLDLINDLSLAIQNAYSSGVPSYECECGTERLEELRSELRTQTAHKAMNESLNTHDVSIIQAAIKDAKDAGVDAAEIIRVERSLSDLREELELANNKVELLKRRIEHAMAAKEEAENAESSADVEKLLGDHGVISALSDAIKDAKKTRMVRKGEIHKAEAVLPEVVADLKRILASKKAYEMRMASERLRVDMDAARGSRPVTHVVVDTLRLAIAAAREFDAEIKEAEALLAQLSSENEQAVQSAHEGLEQALSSKNAVAIKDCLNICNTLLLTDVCVGAVAKIREIITEDIAVAYATTDKEERLNMIGKMEVLIGLLRACGDTQLRQLHNSLQDLKGALRVFARIRPMNNKEKKRNDGTAIEALDPFTLGVTGARGNHEQDHQEVYAYDAVFGQESTQQEVFNEVRSLVQSAFDGYNVTIFTYGQTGAGKTWTLYGSGQEPGISPRTCEVIFSTAAREEAKYDISVQASMIELYCSNLRDLCWRGKDEPPKLELRNVRRRDGTPAVTLEGATSVPVANSEQLAKVVQQGLEGRQTRATQMNAESSRSHLMLMINVEVMDKAGGRTRSGKITIVDLAGSERLGKSGVTGDAQKEAIEINKSLTALGDVMGAITSRAKMVPYRNHKLTQLMQDSLGGTAKTLMFVNVSPATGNVDESAQSLKYASRARSIENDICASPGHPAAGNRRGR